MLDDAVSYGRQTKWKYVMLLISLAGFALGALWGLEHRQEFLRLGRTLSTEGLWRTSGCTAETSALALGEQLFLVDGARVTVLDEDLSPVYQLEAENGLQLTRDNTALAYAPCGDRVYILGSRGNHSVRVSGGVDAVIPGENSFAVITSGSGLLTRTKLFDYEGNLTGSVDLKDSAMVRGAFVGDRLAALCYGTDGTWRLDFYMVSGALADRLPLDAEICYDLITVGENIVLWTADELLFLDETGQCVGNFLLGSGEILTWDTGERDYLALVLCSRGEYYLKSFSQTGQVLGEAVLPMEIRDLEVTGTSICVLDFENLRVYDAFCDLQSVSGEGARAVTMTATDKALWLLGDGEIMQLNS